jgi:phosphoglycerate dehydrogenase-like enzyme
MAFQIGLTADFLDPDGNLTYQDIGLHLIDEADGVERAFFDVHKPEIQSSQVAGFDAVLALTPLVTAATLKESDRLTHIGRFGVGYDSVDVDACTEADVVLTITAGGVNYSVAESVVAFMLALSHKMLIKDWMTREGRWNERSDHMGSELRDRTLGIVGLGGIGATLAEMVSPFRMKELIAFDPFLSEERAAELGVRLVSLEDLMREADFISVNCPLNDATRNLIGATQIGLMKPTAYLINTARGGIVDEAPLIEALKANRIAGAALDCHEQEPLPSGSPIAELDNVIVAPHAVAWSNELFRDLGHIACQQMIDVSHGKIPHGVVNTDVLERPGFQAKLARYGS